MQVLAAVGFKGRRLAIPEESDEFLVDLMKRCWQETPDDRPSFDMILQELENHFIYSKIIFNNISSQGINNNQITASDTHEHKNKRKQLKFKKCIFKLIYLFRDNRESRELNVFFVNSTTKSSDAVCKLQPGIRPFFTR